MFTAMSSCNASCGNMEALHLGVALDLGSRILAVSSQIVGKPMIP